MADTLHCRIRRSLFVDDEPDRFLECMQENVKMCKRVAHCS